MYATSRLSTNAPRQIDVDLTISLTNIIRDHGAGIERCSICSIAPTSSSASGWMSSPLVVLTRPPFLPSDRLLQGRARQRDCRSMHLLEPPLRSNRLLLGSRDRLLSIRRADVDRLDEVGVAEIPRELGVEAGSR